jgi:hypothetical protein
MSFLPFLIPHLYGIPFYLIWLAGIVYAVVNREKHPRTSLLAGIALGILLLENLVSAILSAYIQYQSMNGDVSVSQLGIRYTTLSICSLPFSIAGWVLLLVAIFGWKNVSEHQPVNQHADRDILL